MEQQMKQIGYGAEKLPLGKVDKIVITKAYQILKDIESELVIMMSRQLSTDDQVTNVLNMCVVAIDRNVKIK